MAAAAPLLDYFQQPSQHYFGLHVFNSLQQRRTVDYFPIAFSAEEWFKYPRPVEVQISLVFLR